MAIRSLHGLSGNFTLTPPLFKPPRYGPACRVQFLKETDNSINKINPWKRHHRSPIMHKMAFASLLSFIQDEVLAKHRAIFVSDLLACTRRNTPVLGKLGQNQMYQFTLPKILLER
jgi:hypothetical protein